MGERSIKGVGEKLTEAGKFGPAPIAIYGAVEPPENAVPMNSLGRCLARAVVTLATKPRTPPLYISKDTLEGCCGGGTAWLGFEPFDPDVKYFVSTGIKSFRNGAAEYLRATPYIAEKSFLNAGRITPLGRHIVVQACADLDGDDPGVKSVLCFGTGEQIRNICALVQFRIVDPFSGIIAAQGPSCASFVTYASGMAENAPKDTVILGPCDPTGNSWFPQDMLSIAIPIKVARRMADDLDDSFIRMRPHVAYPDRRTKIKPKSMMR